MGCTVSKEVLFNCKKNKAQCRAQSISSEDSEESELEVVIMTEKEMSCILSQQLRPRPAPMQPIQEEEEEALEEERGFWQPTYRYHAGRTRICIE
jgi:hypothetical protein